MDVSALVWLAGGDGLRPASYSHRLKKKAITGPLEPVEQETDDLPDAILTEPPKFPAVFSSLHGLW